jgi:hypothetical protein
LCLLKNEEDDAEVRQIETLRHRRSQLEVKLFTENLKNEGTGTIRLEHRIVLFFPFYQSPLFPLFIGQRRKRQVLTNEEKQFSLETFSTRPHICN